MSDKKGGRPNPKEFRRVRETKEEGDARKATSKENEVRVVASRSQRMYIKYAIDILTGAEEKPKSESVILSGMGNAVYNVVNVVEILKRRVKGLHQTTEISSQTMTDKYEAVEEGKEGLEVERKVSVIEIVLSTKELDTKHSGYQAPLPESEVTEQDERIDEPRERRPRKKAEKKEAPAKKEEGEKKERAPRRRNRGEKKDGEKKDAPAKKADGEKKEGGRPRRERGERKERRDEDRPARGERRERDDDRPTRGGRGGRSTGGRGRDTDRDDRAPTRGGRGGARREESDRPTRGGRGGYSEGRREGGRGGSDRPSRGTR